MKFIKPLLGQLQVWSEFESKIVIFVLKKKRDLIKIVIVVFIYADLTSFQKITESIKNFIDYGSLIMTESLNINSPGKSVSRLHPRMSNVIGRSARSSKKIGNISYTKGEISEAYDKCFKENLTIIKNCVLRKSLAYIPMSSRITLNSNYTDIIRSGNCVKESYKKYSHVNHFYFY
jgi:hypothetical protein